jgi:hypothetical protein
VFESYRANLEELFHSRCEVMRHGTILKDTTSIVFNKPEVIPEVRPDPLPSHNDIQSMIKYALERQAKSTDQLLPRLIEERDGKKLETTSTGRWHFNAKPLCLADEPLSQLNHHRGFGSYFWDATANCGQHVQAWVHTHTMPNFAMPNPGSTLYSPGHNGWAYTNPNSDCQAPYVGIRWLRVI